MQREITNEEFFKEHEQLHGHTFSEDEKEAFVKQEFECGCCWDNFKKTFLDFTTLEDGTIVCDECYYERYMNRCPICWDYYENPEKPTDTYFAVSKEGAEDQSVTMGIYHVLDYPVFRSDYFSAELIESNIELIKALDINHIHNVLYSNNDEEIRHAEFICECCAEKYTHPTFLATAVKEAWRVKSIHDKINIRGALQKGFEINKKII